MNTRKLIAISVVLLTAASPVLGATFVKGLVPDWNQPYWHGANGPNGGPAGAPPGPWGAWCTPTSAANILGYWEDKRGYAISDGAVAPASGVAWPNWPAWQDYQANGFNRGGVPAGTADDLGWYMDTNWLGDAAFGNPAHTGTYLRDISGFDAAGAWAGLNRFFTARGTSAVGFRPRTQGLGYADPGLPLLTQAQAWNQIQKQINADRPLMVAFMHWVLNPPVGNGSDASPEGSLGWTYRTFAPWNNQGDIWGNGEVWNDTNISGSALGHVVTVVGYIVRNTPEDILGNTDWVIVHDNVGQTARNVAVPFISNTPANNAPWLANTVITGYSDAPYGFGPPETVDNVGDTGRWVSLAVDGDDNPHISYVDWTNADLRYATKSGGVWTTETVDAAPAYVEGTSIALTTDGSPRIAYAAEPILNQPRDLYYAAKAAGWTTTMVFNGTNANEVAMPSLVLDTQNHPRIAHYRAWSELWLSQNNGFGWAGGHTLLDANCPVGGVFNTFTAIDVNGFLHIAYSDYVVSGIYIVQRLKYAYNACGFWAASWVESFAGSSNYSVGQMVSVAVGSDGRRTLSHYALSEGDLRVAQVGGGCGGQFWNRYAVDNNIAQGSTVVRYDSADRPIIAYWGACPGVPQAYACMKLARWDGAQWVIQTAYDPGGVGANTYWLSMDLDVYNRPHIAFYGPDAATLRYVVARHRGDLNGDGGLSLEDRDLLVALLLDPTAFTDAQRAAADCNGDGELNGLDIQAFLDLLLS